MKPIRCAIYTRTGRADADALHSQRAVAEIHLVGQGMTVLPERYDDDGRSGRAADRPALQRLLHDIAAGGIDRVVVQRFDRLSRDLALFAELVHRFDHHGVILLSATERINAKTLVRHLTVS